jgi:hypothetical protein
VLDLSLERDHTVLRLGFTGQFDVFDLDAIDPALLRFLTGVGRELDRVRCLYDMTRVTKMTVPTDRFAARAKRPPLLPFGRVVVPPAEAPADFGISYRSMRGRTAHEQPLIVPSLDVAYGYLGILGSPQFEPVP